MRAAPCIEEVEVGVYRVLTDHPESDGTLSWDATTLVVVELASAGRRGLGYTYADAATARVVRDVLAPIARGHDALAAARASEAMVRAVRNLGARGIAAMAISAVDAALWDLAARILDVPLVKLLGDARDAVPIYGSGGFTSYDVPELVEQLGGWVERGLTMVKMKVGRDPAADVERVAAVRAAIGPRPALFVDANGAYTRKQALAQARAFAAHGVTWFEEPVTSDDLDGLRLLRDQGPPGMAIAAGEYGYAPATFARLIAAGAVDVLQADATRCLGVTGFLGAAALCRASSLPLSGHCAPALHVHVGCAASSVVHLEYFHDHVRIERMLLDGVVDPVGGALRPDRSRPGNGLALRRADAERYRID